MPRFAALQARLNDAVGRHLSDASAVWQGGEPFDVVFQREGVAALGEVEGYMPTVSFDIANTPGIEQGSELVVNGVAYTVAADVEPDESGWLDQLRLRKAA